MNGEYFKQFVTKNFNEMFIKYGNKDERSFIQDGDPSQKPWKTEIFLLFSPNFSPVPP